MDKLVDWLEIGGLAVALFTVLRGLWVGVGWTGRRLFGEETGIVTKWVKDQTDLIATLKGSLTEGMNTAKAVQISLHEMSESLSKHADISLKHSDYLTRAERACVIESMMIEKIAKDIGVDVTPEMAMLRELLKLPQQKSTT